MTRVLMTAYGAYDDWETNASWLAMQALTLEMPTHVELTTRLYQVDFESVRTKLAEDVRQGYDVILHLGQSPGSGQIELEAFGVNIARRRMQPRSEATPLESDGPVAYRSQLPLEDWARLMRQEGIPADVSFHAGDYLCNAALYWSHYYSEQAGLPCLATFLHVPLDPSQVVAKAAEGKNLASLPAETTARALRLLLESLPAAKQLV